MAKSKHYGPGPPSETFASFDKDRETAAENPAENSSKSKSYGAPPVTFNATGIGMSNGTSNATSNGASKSYGQSTSGTAPNGVDTVNGEKYEEIVDSEDEANVRAAAEAIQAIRGTPGTE